MMSNVVMYTQSQRQSSKDVLGRTQIIFDQGEEVKEH